MTKTTRHTPRPVESFGPEILQALIEGAKRTIRIPLTWEKAVYFRQRVNQLRVEMRNQKHEKYSAVSQARLTITWEDDVPVRITQKRVKIPISPNAPVFLTIAPADQEFAEALAKAGVVVPQLTPNNNDKKEEKVEMTDDFLESFVKNSSP